MFRKSFWAVVLGLLTIVPMTMPHARERLKDTDPQLVKRPAVIIPEGVILDINMEVNEGGFGPYSGTFIVKVLASGKGAKEGHTVVVHFSGGGGSSCGFNYAPFLGPTINKLVLFGPDDDLRMPGCSIFDDPVYPDKDVLASYRQRWLELDAKARAEPNNIAAWRALGDYLYEWWDLRGALAAYEHARGIMPGDATLGLKVSGLQARQWRLEMARKTLGELPKTEETEVRATLVKLQIAALETMEKSSSIKSFYISAPAPILTGKDISGIYLRAMKLTGVRAAHSNWKKAYIVDSTLQHADFSGVDLSEARFRETDLTGANFSSARAAKAVITDSTLTGVRAERLQAEGIDFSGSDLSGGTFRDANLRGAKFDGTDLSGVDFRGADLNGASFQFVKVNCKTRFPDGFDSKTGRWITEETCDSRYPLNFDNIKFTGSIGDHNELIRKVLARISFEGRDMRGASFRKAELSSSPSFRDADIRQVDFSGCSFSSTDFSGANAENANFSAVSGEIGKTAGADFSGSVLLGTPEAKARPVPPNKMPFRLTNENGLPRLTGARIRNVGITFPDWQDRDGNRENLLSFLDATIMYSEIDCRMSIPESVSGTHAAEPGKKAWDRYILTLDVVRKIVARNPTTWASDRCANAIATYLDDDCREGRVKAGFAYACPSPP